MCSEGYPFNKCILFQLKNKRKLATFLETSLDNLVRLSKDGNYTVHIEKQSTKEREIERPSEELKEVQTKLLRLMSIIDTPNWLSSGVKGKSYIDNALTHKDSRYILKTDINSFYNSCERKYVFLFFKRKLETSSDVAFLLTDLVTYKGHIPTGAPTSQIVAFWSYYDAFSKIHKIGLNYNLKVSLYVDDIVLSSNKSITNRILYKVHGELRKVGLKLKSRKTRFYNKGDCKKVTGVIITPDNKMKIPNGLRKKAIDLVKELEGVKEPDQGRVKVLVATIKSAQQIESDFLENTLRRYKKLIK